MIINHNMNASNAHRLMTGNTMNAGKSMEKLSSGLRINRAGDDAAGLAISEKMRAQIRGLDQASRNSQDGISMLQTAEGALNETHSILQRMRELATQAASDTNVTVDRDEIQKEMNQLSSEINRIGNTTEFNTQSILKGNDSYAVDTTGIANLTSTFAAGTTVHTAASQTLAFSNIANGNSIDMEGKKIELNLNGNKVTINFDYDAAATLNTATADTANATDSSVTITYRAGATALTSTNLMNAVKTGLDAVIQKNSNLYGNYSTTASTGTGMADLTITALSTGDYAGAKGNIGTTADPGTAIVGAGAASVGDSVDYKAYKDIDLTSYNTVAEMTALVGTGMTINDKQIEFYNADNGAYEGNAIGVDISDAVTSGAATDLVSAIATQLGTSGIEGVNVHAGTATATDTFGTNKGTSFGTGHLIITNDVGGAVGNKTEISDGGVSGKFEATFQVGANQSQGFKIDINDMRAVSLAVTGKAGEDASVTGATFTATNTVTDGTSDATKEAALDVSSYEKATAAIKVINNAIESVSAERSKLGAFQNRLEHTIANLGTSSENLSSAESRIRDVDMAKEMMTFSKNNILSQAAQAMLAQANQQPQGVLQLLR